MCSFTRKWPYNWTYYHSSYSSYYCWIFGLWMWEECSCHTYKYEFLCWYSSWGNVKSLRLNLHRGCAIYYNLWKKQRSVYGCMKLPVHPSTSFCGSNTWEIYIIFAKFTWLPSIFESQNFSVCLEYFE